MKTTTTDYGIVFKSHDLVWFATFEKNGFSHDATHISDDEGIYDNLDEYTGWVSRIDYITVKGQRGFSISDLFSFTLEGGPIEEALQDEEVSQALFDNMYQELITTYVN
jgi:hypothetical protein